MQQRLAVHVQSSTDPLHPLLGPQWQRVKHLYFPRIIAHFLILVIAIIASQIPAHIPALTTSSQSA